MKLSAGGRDCLRVLTQREMLQGLLSKFRRTDRTPPLPAMPATATAASEWPHLPQWPGAAR